MEIFPLFENHVHAKHVRNGVESLPTFEQNQEILQSTLTTFACTPKIIQSATSSNSIYNERTMKTKHFLVITAALLGFLILALSLTNFNPPAALALDSYTDQYTQPDADRAAQVNDSSEIGSTDGIVVMGIVIVLIVTLPLAFRRKK